MSRYVLSPRARADLEEIWDYTAQRWGIDQAEVCIRLLQGAIETLADDPHKGRPCSEVRAGYRSHSVGSHVLFFRSIKSVIDIVRILHNRMDFERHL